MKHQVLFSLKNNEKIFMNVSAAVVTGALRVKVNTNWILQQLAGSVLKTEQLNVAFSPLSFSTQSMTSQSLSIFLTKDKQTSLYPR